MVARHVDIINESMLMYVYAPGSSFSSFLSPIMGSWIFCFNHGWSLRWHSILYRYILSTSRHYFFFATNLFFFFVPLLNVYAEVGRSDPWWISAGKRWVSGFKYLFRSNIVGPFANIMNLQ